MNKIEIGGNWKTITGAVRALNREIKKTTGYTVWFNDVDEEYLATIGRVCIWRE